LLEKKSALKFPSPGKGQIDDCKRCAAVNEKTKTPGQGQIDDCKRRAAVNGSDCYSVKKLETSFRRLGFQPGDARKFGGVAADDKVISAAELPEVLEKMLSGKGVLTRKKIKQGGMRKSKEFNCFMILRKTKIVYRTGR
jgi:hypothetical protein